MAANVNLMLSDAFGTTSFNAAGHWDSLAAPAAGNDYFTANFTLRTPDAGAATSFTFAGDALTVNAGGTISFKRDATAALSTYTINNLTLAGGSLFVGTDNRTVILTGNQLTLAPATTSTMTAGATGELFRNLIVNSPINGSGALTTNGSFGAANHGIVTLSGNNSFTGNVTVNTGRLRISNSNALGLGPKTITVTNGSAGRVQLLLDGSGGDLNLAANLSYNTSNANESTILNEAGNNTINGAITLTGGGGDTRIGVSGGTLTLAGNIAPNTTNRNLRLEGAGNGTVSGVIAGSGANQINLRKEDGGTWTLSNTNTFSGTTTINGGTIRISADANLGAAPGAFTANQLQLNGGTLQTTTGMTLNANRGVTVGAADGTITLGGAMTYFGRFTGTGNTLNVGGGDFVLRNSTGVASDVDFNVLSGRLFFSSNNALGTGTVTVNPSARLVNNSASTASAVTNTVNILDGGGLSARVATTFSNVNLPTAGFINFNGDDAVTAALAVTNGVVLAGDLTVQVGGLNASVGTSTLSGDISGAGGLNKISTGTLVLSGTNSYSGTTTVNGGTLALSGGNAIGNAGAVVLANTAGVTLLLNNSETIGSLAGGGTTGGNVNLQGNTLTTGGNNTSTAFAGVISGVGGQLTKTGSGTMTLSGTNTYTGGTTIANSGGTLTITNPAALGSGPITLQKSLTNTGALELALTGTNTISNTFIGMNSSFTFSGGGQANIINTSGANTIASNLTVTNTGGDGFNIVVNGGSLDLAGTLSSTVAAPNPNRTLTFGGTGTGGLVSGIIADGAGLQALNVIKANAGTWTFDGPNS